MKIARSILIVLWIVGFHHTITAQQLQEKTVMFQVYSPDLPDSTRVFIAGSLAEVGSWNPATTLMQYEGNHRWSKKIVVKEDPSIEYKFTLGSWDREAANANGLPLQNFNLAVRGDTTVTHTILFWKTGGDKKVITGQITGTVAYHRQLTGEGIAPRDIVVWLPPDYTTNKKKRYPVVYMQDGQNSVDPATSAFGIDWQIDEASDSLIRNKITQSFIVVGIYNTADRTKDYTPGDGGTAYMKFVVKKVKPIVDSAYRTKSDAKNTIVGGSSAGGLISFMLAWEYPNVFSKAICMSPAFKIMHIDYVKAVLESKEKKNVFFYIDNGGVGLETQLQPGIDEMMTALKQKGYKEGRDYFYILDPAAKHFESDWAKRFPKAVSICLEH
jgi:predicted alpha/beta superfamily hydrolase